MALNPNLLWDEHMQINICNPKEDTQMCYNDTFFKKKISLERNSI